MTYSETWLPTPTQIEGQFTAVWMVLLGQIDAGQVDAGQIDTGTLRELSSDERAHAASLASAGRRHEFIVGRRLLHRALARTSFDAYTAADITTGAHGKPQLAAAAGLDFNLSHSGDLLVLVLSTQGPVGVDVESLERQLNVERLAKRFCHSAEQAWLDGVQPAHRHRMFLEFWVRKEAVLKARGDGVHGHPARVDAISQMEASHAPASVTLDASTCVVTRGAALYQCQPNANGISKGSAEAVLTNATLKEVTANDARPNKGPDLRQQWQLHRLPVVAGYIGCLAGAAASVDIALYDGRALLEEP